MVEKLNLERVLRENNLAQKDLAKFSNVSHETLNNYLNGSNANLSKLQDLVKGLNTLIKLRIFRSYVYEKLREKLKKVDSILSFSDLIGLKAINLYKYNKGETKNMRHSTIEKIWKKLYLLGVNTINVDGKLKLLELNDKQLQKLLEINELKSKKFELGDLFEKL